MGSRGSGSGRGVGPHGAGSGGANGSSGNEAYKSSPDYQESYQWEIDTRMNDAAVPAALSNRDDDTVETQMRGYASAIGDPIRAMENQRRTIAEQYEDYKAAKSNYDLGTRDALKQVLDDYDAGIERMKNIKKNSKRPDLL